MKKFLLTSAALCALIAPAAAADLAARPYTKAPPFVAAAPLYSWTGFYIGGHLGGAFQGNNNNIFGTSDNGRFIGGGQVGFDYQFSGSWLLGVEAQYSYVDRNNNTPFAFAGGTFNQNLRGLGSVTGRLGYTWGPGLIYAKGGYAYADTRNDGTGLFRFDNGRDGYTIGGGLEYMFARNFSAKVEYMYYQFDRNQLFTGAPLVGLGNYRLEEHTIKVGLNYRFNLASPLTPVY